MGDSRARSGPVARPWPFAILTALVIVGAGGAGAQPADGKHLTVTLASDQTIREIAQEYLGDPDLWAEILRSSGIDSITDLRPGSELKIPVTEISAANRALRESLGQIQVANETGAQIFAPDNIERAVDLQEQAQTKRLQRLWGETKDLADASFSEATAAIEIAVAQRDQKAEALVSDRNGRVEGQRPEDVSWRDLDLREILVEEEKVRTLSRSTAQITFRDASRLRLNANSNAIIKMMRYDPLKNTEEAEVSLVEGDFYALLAGDEDRSSFDIELSDIETDIQSDNFWVANDDENAKFANYDEGSVSVAAGGETVTLGRNQGTFVARGDAPIDSVSLLAPPEPATPADESVVHIATPEISWSAVDGAEGYWLEIAEDQNFDNIIESHFGLVEPKVNTGELPVGEYFWHVSSLDGFGLPGVRSPAFRFRVSPDETPPYLKIETPLPDTVFRQATVEVVGESEPGASVSVAGLAADVTDDGRFSATLEAAEGVNAVAVVATDAAGNKTTLERTFRYLPDAESIVAFDESARQVAPRHFITSDAVMSLGGTTTPNAEIEVRAGGLLRASAVTGADGGFRLNVPLAADEERFDFVVTAASGYATTIEIATTIDRDPPAIEFDEILPRLTAKATLRVAGRSEADAVITLNGRALALADGHFDETVTLVPGKNTIELIATDPVGNVRVEKSSVTLDQEPPQLVSSAAIPVTNAGQQVLALSVVAEDSSGLAKAAPFVVTTVSGDYSGYLRYNKAAKTYEAIVVLPEAEIDEAKLGRVELSDDAGNRKTFDVTQEL